MDRQTTPSTMAPPARRGRPPLMTPDGVLDRIRRLHRQRDGLFRIHRAHPDLYARARRLFGSWSMAVSAAGIDYWRVLDLAVKRSARARRNGRGLRAG